MFFGIASPRSAGFVTVSNLTVSTADTPGPVSSGVRFNSDGSIDENQDGSYDTAFQPGEWWSAEPITGIGATFDIRCASLTSGSWDTEPAAVGTWVDLSSAQEWLVTRSGPSGSTQCIANFEIRNGAGTTVATFSVDATATIL